MRSFCDFSGLLDRLSRFLPNLSPPLDIGPQVLQLPQDGHKSPFLLTLRDSFFRKAHEICFLRQARLLLFLLSPTCFGPAQGFLPCGLPRRFNALNHLNGCA